MSGASGCGSGSARCRCGSRVPSGTAPDGISGVVNPVTVTVGGQSAEVYFAGLVPGVATGASVPLTLSAAGVDSNTAALSIQ